MIPKSFSNENFIESCLSTLKKRETDQKSKIPTQKALAEMNKLQHFLIPKNIDLFLDSMPKILETLLLACDDVDVSIRHNASVILNSSVQVIMPFQKNAILQFISSHCNNEFKPHALIAMIELSLKVAIFLTKKVAIELFNELLPLFLQVAKSQSEISSEGFYLLASQVRVYFQEKENRMKVIELLAKRNFTDISADWDVKAGAILAYPDLIDESCKLFTKKLQFLAALPNQTIIPDIPNDMPFEVILPFVERNPQIFFDRLQKPPTDPRQVAPYLFCLKIALQNGFKPEFDLSFLTNISQEPNISQLQLECLALGKLSGVIDPDLSQIVTQCNASSITALSLCFNRYPLPYFFDAVLKMDYSKPVIAKSVIIFLTEVDFSLFPMKLKESVDILASIAKNGFEIVQQVLCERAPLFNCGNTYPLYMRLLESADYFDAGAFKNTSTLLSYLSSPKVDDCTNVFFASLTEIDSSIIWSDITSLDSFLDVVRRFCMHSRRIRIPQFVAILPQLVLYIIVYLICKDIPKGNHMIHLQQSFNCQSGQTILSVLSKQHLVSLLQLRDRAAAAIGALKTQIVIDEKVLDSLGKKLITWPSSNTWYLLSSSAKIFCETIGGLLSSDPKIVYAAAQLFPQKLHDVDQNNTSPDLIVLAIEKGEKIDFTLSIPLVKAADRRKEFPEPIIEKLKGSWMVVCIKKHVEIEPVVELSKKPFSEWEGPPQFWDLVPSFILKLKARGMIPPMGDKLSPTHLSIINRHIKLFRQIKDIDSHINFIPQVTVDNTIKGSLVSQNANDNSSYGISLDEEPIDMAPEIIRELRLELYKRAEVNSFHDLVIKSRNTRIKVYQELPRIIHDYLMKCDSDVMTDICYFAIELATICGNDNIEILQNDCVNFILNIAPFRSNAVELFGFKWAPKRIPLSEFANGIVFTETEILSLAKYQIKEGHRTNTTTAQPLSPTSLGEIAKIIGKQFYICLLYGIIPPYSKENEKDITTFIEKYGISEYSAKVLLEWCKTNSPTNLMKAALNIVFNNGTYFPEIIYESVKESVSKNKDIALTVEAYILAYDDNTKLRNAIAKLINSK